MMIFIIGSISLVTDCVLKKFPSSSEKPKAKLAKIYRVIATHATLYGCKSWTLT
jgi:hypothetical protein